MKFAAVFIVEAVAGDTPGNVIKAEDILATTRNGYPYEVKSVAVYPLNDGE